MASNTKQLESALKQHIKDTGADLNKALSERDVSVSVTAPERPSTDNFDRLNDAQKKRFTDLAEVLNTSPEAVFEAARSPLYDQEAMSRRIQNAAKRNHCRLAIVNYLNSRGAAEALAAEGGNVKMNQLQRLRHQVVSGCIGTSKTASEEWEALSPEERRARLVAQEAFSGGKYKRRRNRRRR